MSEHDIHVIGEIPPKPAEPTKVAVIELSKSISSPRLSDDADQNPMPEMYGVITLATLAGQGATATVEPAKPKLPQHLVWRCTCGHVEKTKTRDAS